METEKSCCFTGYRPAKFPFPLRRTSADYIALENALTEIVFDLAGEGVTDFYCGMAMGFDLLAADTVLLAKKAFPAVRLIAVLPFPQQAKNFPPLWKRKYTRLLAEADCTVTVCGDYEKGCYQQRNVYMVRHSDVVVTWFDGQPGGTKQTLYCAQKNGRRIINLHDSSTTDFGEYPIFTLWGKTNQLK